ncbi:MAG TPA: hypothetical protein VF729_08545 [Solirubrobacterales bacterium]
MAGGPQNTARAAGSRFWNLAAEYGEPVVAILAGLALAVLGLTGEVNGDDLAAATLVVLSLLALSLLRERLLRIEANKNVEDLGARLDETIDAVNAIQSGNPYSVLSHETTWDIAASDGSLVHATRIKRIRIDQNNVFALYDFSTGDGDRTVEYSPGTRVSTFMGHGGKDYDLIDLGRIYNRGERLDFTVRRTVRDGFLANREIVAVDTRDATERMILTILWPPDRPPKSLILGRGTPSHDWRNEDVLSELTTEDGRPTYRADIYGPEKGGSTTIEWEWDPVSGIDGQDATADRTVQHA